jgi:hypothetical protein
MSHWEEVKLMLEKHDELVSELRTTLKTVTELVAPGAPDQAITMDDDEDEVETKTDPSILGALNED